MVDYGFYMNSYRGSSIPAESWMEYEARAATQLSRYKRIYTVKAPEENSEAFAVCAMAEAMYSFDLIANGEGMAVQSASVGSVSVSYGSRYGSRYGSSNPIDISTKAQAKELYRCACLYLDIYRG